MARHRKRRHRGFGDYVSVPSLGGLVKDVNPFGKSVKSTDVFVGAGLGLALGAGVKYALNRFLADKLPAVVMSYAGPISTFLGGVALYFFEQKKNRGRAQGHLIGATLAAATPIYWNLLGSYGPKMADGTPFFSDYVMTSYGLLSADQPFGILTADGAMRGYGGSEEWDPMSAP